MIIDNNFSTIMERVFSGRPFQREESEALVSSMIDGRLSDTRMAAVLTGMRFAGPETQHDILMGALESIANHRKATLTSHQPLIDLAGIGARSPGGSPVLILAGVVAAAAGAHVAFFGSKSFSGQYNNSEFIESLGARPAATCAEAEHDLNLARITSLRASAFYPPFQHLTAVRRSLGFHTILDLVVPLAHPAPLSGQLLGVFSPELVPVVARLLAPRKRALVFCSEMGCNQLSAAGVNHVAVIEDGHWRTEKWGPGALGCDPARAGTCLSAEAADSAVDLLEGRLGEGPLVEEVVLNAGVALWIGSQVQTLSEGVILARTALAEGAAHAQWRLWQST